MLSLTYSLADQNFLTTKSVGIFNLSCQLLERLARRPEIQALTVLANSTLEGRLNLPATAGWQRHETAIRGRLQRMLWDQWGVYRAARRTGHEWLFLPKGFASFGAACPARLALYVHDAMLDFYASRYPAGFSRMESWYFRQCFRASLRRAAVIFTNSDFTRHEIERVARRDRLPMPPAATIGIGFTPPGRCPAKRDIILVLASRYPHKRSDLAVAWMDRWQQRAGGTAEVHWVGSFPERLEVPQRPAWRCHRRLEEADYRALVEAARVLVFFSEYEGFGMPPVEVALAGGCPVYSDIPVTREVMAGAGFAFANDDFESFCHAMNGALAATPGQREAWAGELARRHNWDQVCEKAIAAWSEPAAATRGRS
jgi:glycosyltransferase involved in cell wall biosynthesis